MIYWEDSSRFQGVLKTFVVYQPEKKQFSPCEYAKVDLLKR